MADVVARRRMRRAAPCSARNRLVSTPRAPVDAKPPDRGDVHDRRDGAALSELASRSHRPLVYLVFPALIWAALRFGQRGATVSILIAVGFTVWNTTHLEVRLLHRHQLGSVLSTQLFIAVASLSTLCLAAVVSEREQFAETWASRAHSCSGPRMPSGSGSERNLHDGAQQRLLALAVHLRLAAQRAEQAPEQAAGLIQEAEAELQVATDELRELSQGIHPAILTDLGLADAVRSVAARSAVQVKLLELPTRRVGGLAEATAYLVFMEAVANAQKHAGASTIRVRASSSPRELRIEVADDGVGGAAEGAGSGLRGLRQRVEDVGGSFSV